MDEFQNQLSKKERRELKRRAKEEARLAHNREKRMRGVTKKVLIFGLGVLLIGVVYWMVRANGPDTSPQVAKDPLQMCVQHGSGTSMHIHSNIEIVIKGEKQHIPTNIGIPSPQCMRPIHTHDATGLIHFEFPEKRDVPLGDFFRIWDKTFSSACIFEFCNGPDGNVKMTVNGEPNEEFEKYIMKDQDHIKITYAP